MCMCSCGSDIISRQFMHKDNATQLTSMYMQETTMRSEVFLKLALEVAIEVALEGRKRTELFKHSGRRVNI